MKKSIILLVVFALIIIILVGFLVFMPGATQQPVDTNLLPQINSGLEVTMPKVNDVVSSPLKITGKTSGNGWIGFEGQVGLVRLFDSSNNELGLAILTAKGEWMQKEINFETELTFISPGTGASGSLVFYNENPSGDPVRDKTFALPVKFQ